VNSQGRSQAGSRDIRVAVVGAGHMGRLHAAKIAAAAECGLPVRLSAVADVIPGRARSLAARFGCAWHVNANELLGAVDAVVVAVPTSSHFEVVSSFLRVGVDVLVEKPIATTLEEAEEMIALAAAGGLILQVGHLEWYNAVTRVLEERVQRPHFVEAQRVGPFTERAADIDVVRDMMIHDLDILHQLFGEEPERVEAVGLAVLTRNIDIANARITYPGGCVASLTASRVSSAPSRRMRFYETSGSLQVDFLDPSASWTRRGESGPSGAGVNGSGLVIDKIDVGSGDALSTQFEAFFRALETRDVRGVDARSGLGALRSALRVLEAIPVRDRRGG